MKVTLIPADSPDDLAAKAAAHFVAKATAAGGRFVVALSGGSTPRLFHNFLAEERSEHVDWSRLHFLLSDERALPPSDPNSNFFMAQETLLKPLGIPRAQIYRPEADASDLGIAASQYETIVAGLTSPPGAVDLVVLGMGDDGHTASLFPGEAEPGGLVAAVSASTGTVADRRLTFTYEALSRARSMLILISGRKKAARLKQVLTEDGDLPMQRVLRGRKGDTTIIADRDALLELEPSQIEELK